MERVEQTSIKKSQTVDLYILETSLYFKSKCDLIRGTVVPYTLVKLETGTSTLQGTQDGK